MRIWNQSTGAFGDICIIDGMDFVGTNSITGNELAFVSFTSNDFPCSFIYYLFL